MGHVRVAIGHECHDMAKAQAEGKIPADTGLDDFARKLATPINGVALNGLSHLWLRQKPPNTTKSPLMHQNPLHMVKPDLDSGALVRIRVQGVRREVLMPMGVVLRKDTPPGPAGRAFIAQLKN